MTTSIVPATMNPEEARLNFIVEEIKKGLMEINKQMELQPKTNLPEAQAVIGELQKRKGQMLAKWLMLATKVRDQINQIAQRNSIDVYREIVPLVERLEAWGQDAARADESDTANQLKRITDESRTVQEEVRRRLVGDREARAREYMALAEQACEVPFVRAIPLLNACKLWAELAEIIKGIEEPPAEHQIAKSELEKCDQDMHKIIRDYQSQHTRLEVEQLTSDWRGAKSLEDEEAALSSIRQLLPLSPTRIPIPEEFLDAFWRRHEMSVANKMIEIRVQRLLERATVTSLGFEERSLALHEAQGLVRSSDNDLFERINNARMQLRSDATGRLEEDNRQFEQRMAEKSYDHAVSILNHMATVLRHCDDDETRWSQRLKELSNRLNEARQPSGPEIALQRLVEMMERAIHSEPQQMYDALESIEKVLREIPMDLSPVLGGLKDKVTKHAGKLVESLPEPEGITQHTIRRYIDDICNGKIGLQTMART